MHIIIYQGHANEKAQGNATMHINMATLKVTIPSIDQNIK